MIKHRVGNALQIILDLCIPEIELANTHSQISSIYLLSHSWYSVRNYWIPKGIMKTRFEPRLPRMSSHGKIINCTHWIRTLAPCITSQYFTTRPRKTLSKPALCRYWYILEPLMCGVQFRAYWGDSTSLWYPACTVVLNRTSIFLLKYIFSFWHSYVEFRTEVWLLPFWNNVIQISIRQMNFQDIYSLLWIVQIFNGNIYFS